MKGRAIRPGDAIVFAPGNRPIRFARIGAERFTHPTGGTYRIGYDLAGVGFALYDDQEHGKAHWAALFGAAPDFTGDASTEEYLDRSRGEA